MTRLKKVLSIVLCLSMLLGTLTAGLLFASAEDEEPSAAIPTYEKLAEEADGGDFFYAGYEITENGKATDYLLPAGGSFHVKFFVKTNKDLYQGKYYFAMTNSALFNTSGGKIMPTDGRVNGLSTSWTPTKKTSTNSGFVTGSGDATVSIISGYQPAEIANWVIFEINDKTKTIKNTASDNPICEFDIQLEGGAGEFEFIQVPESFTAASGEKLTQGYQCIGGTNTTNNIPAVDGFRLQPSQKFTVANEVSFRNADETVIENQYPAKNDKIVPPEVDNLYAWADADGNFVDLSNAYMGDESLVYTAILNDTQVEVTLDGNGGLVDGEETKTVMVPVSQTLNLSQYSATKDGDNHKGWAVNGIATTEYTFGSVNPVTASAIWENSAVLKVLIGKASGEWVEYLDYVGVPGETLTQESYDAIENAVEAEFKKTGKSTIECEEEPVYTGLNYLAYEGEAYLGNIDRYAFEEIVFGETPFLFVTAKFVQTANFYYPNTNADGTVIENSWNKYDTQTYEFTSLLDNTNYNPDEPGNLANISCVYKNGAGIAYNPAIVGAEGTSIKVANLQTFENDENSKYLYTSIFKDGKGNEIDASSGAFILNTSGYTVPGVFDLYTCPKDRTYRFAFNATAGGSINNQIIDKEFVIGDTFTKADLASCFSTDRVDTKYDANVLLEDCAIIDRPGYKLVDLWYGSDESTDETSILKGNTVTLTKELVDSSLTTLTVKGKNYDAVMLSCSFDTMDYEFTVMYQKADGSWDVLTKKTFNGKQAVTYAALIDADLEKQIEDNLPTGQLLNKSGFTVESTGAVKSSFYAYEGPLTIRVQYMSDQRSAFIDFNNGKDGVEIGYRKTDVKYGTVIYDPNYDSTVVKYDENGDKIEAPYFNNFLDAGDSNIPSKTVKTHKKDGDGNPMYEPAYEDVLDEDGNVVIDDITGEPKKQIKYEEAKDENGNVKLDKDGKPIMQIVYDMNKPIYLDEKGESPFRPYRACEFMGTKVYHVNSPIRNWSDMPAQSEWIEGYENDECRVYNTTILQLQWKSDEDFFFRVYDTTGFFMGLPIIGDGFSLNMNGNIYSALGKDFKWYYWKDNRPCKKGEGTLNTNPENWIIMLLWPKKEVLELGVDENGNPITSEGWYFSALPIAKSWFKPSFIPDLIPTLLPLIKGLLN